MLQAYWNLSGIPFDKSIKEDQLFISKSLKELFSRLQYMKQHCGIMMIAGQPGTGKTTALRAFVHQLSELTYQTFYVPLATVNVLDFYRQLNQLLGGEYCHFKAQLFANIQQCIKDMVTHAKRIPVIIFDELYRTANPDQLQYGFY
jgi:general secretion pathway protein A